jgi:hypothetical protein
MDNLFVFIIMGFFLYLIFFRRGGMGGMGCCGGHGGHDDHTGHGDHGGGHTTDDGPSGKSLNHEHQEEVIELGKDQYSVLNQGDEKPV